MQDEMNLKKGGRDNDTINSRDQDSIILLQAIFQKRLSSTFELP